MKKVFLLLVLTIIFITGCSSKNLESINIDELNTKLENKDTFILYCADSDKFELEEKLVTVLEENNLTAYRLDTSKLEDEEKIKLQIKIAYESPSIIFIINGEDPTKLSHITSSTIKTSEIVARLIDMKYIKVIS